MLHMLGSFNVAMVASGCVADLLFGSLGLVPKAP
jgi:hypothetical protein